MVKKKVYGQKKRILSLLLAFSMVFALSGCGNGTQDSTAPTAGSAGEGGMQDGKEGGGDAAGADTTGAMGRYVEKEIDLTDRLSSAMGICEREDGSLVVLDAVKGFLISQDKGETWNIETPDWLASMREKMYYVSEIGMAPDGTVGVIYDMGTEEDDYNPVMDLILSDGTTVPVEIELTEDDEYIRQMAITKDNRIFVRTVCGNIYEVYRDGSGESLLPTTEYFSRMYLEGNLIIRDWDGRFGIAPALYDMEAGAEIEDGVLSDFVSENYNDRYFNGDSDCSMYILPDEDSVLYLIGDKGIHRHVIGGNMMEQIVDGNLSMLSNPSYSIVSALVLDDNEFLVLFSNHKLIRFTYDPNVPTVPENVLTIYSLREDEDMRQAVSMYQSKNPDVFVSYEIGIAEGDSATREDAVKKLNTEIMAGTGPDLIMMDELPFDSYVEKGLLLDLTDYLREYSVKEPLYDNIIEALKVDGKAYVAPATFHIPLLMGAEDKISAITDLDKFAEAAEALREEHPGDDIIGICDAGGVMNRFAAVSAPRWLADDGTLNREIIGEYLEQCKRIYDAQMDGIGADVLEYYARLDEQNLGTLSQSTWRIDWEIATDIFQYISGDKYLLSGWLVSPYAYDECLSLERTKGFEDSGFCDMQGQCSNVFKPNTLLGISAASTQPDAAKAFMDFFLSAEAQEHYYSFPLNKEAYDRQAAVPEDYVSEDGAYGYLTLVTEDGTYAEFTVYTANDEQAAKLKAKFAALDTAYMQDAILEDAVFSGGSSYVAGEASLEEALDNIERQAAIYMAE